MFTLSNALLRNFFCGSGAVWHANLVLQHNSISIHSNSCAAWHFARTASIFLADLLRSTQSNLWLPQVVRYRYGLPCCASAAAKLVRNVTRICCSEFSASNDEKCPSPFLQLVAARAKLDDVQCSLRPTSCSTLLSLPNNSSLCGDSGWGSTVCNWEGSHSNTWTECGQDSQFAANNHKLQNDMRLGPRNLHFLDSRTMIRVSFHLLDISAELFVQKSVEEPRISWIFTPKVSFADITALGCKKYMSSTLFQIVLVSWQLQFFKSKIRNVRCSCMWLTTFWGT